MAVDLRGKQTETLDYASMAKELSKATKTVANFNSPKEDPVRDKIKSATEEIIVKLDPKASEEEAKERGWVTDLVESITSRAKPQKTASDEKGTFESHLSRIADAADYLMKDCSVWVGICGLSTTAQKQITSAINMADCCAAVSSAFGKAANKAAKMGATKGMPTATSAAAAAAAGTPNTGSGATPPPLPPTPPTTTAPGGAPGGPNSGGLTQNLAQGATNAQKFASGIGLALRGLNLLANTFQIIHGQLVNTLALGFGANVLQGAVQESNMFRENIRQILHQQQGFTAENRAAEKSFHDLDSAVNASGISRVDYQKLWLKNLQRGYVMQEKGDKAQMMAAGRMKSTITTAANTAKSLGMDVSATTDMFMDWHQHLALSTNDMAEMGRHMKNIARTTGVTGSELQKAMGSAAKMTKALQDAGLASAQALKMATKLAAIAQKHGVGEDFAAIQKALSGSKNFQEAPDAMKGMLMRSAMMTGGEVSPEQVRSGAVSGSPQLQRALFKGMEKETRRFLEMGGFGDKAQTMDLTNINEEIQKLQRTAAESTDMEERNRANNSLIALGQLAEQMGTDLGGLQGRMRTVMENQLSSGDRLTKMTNDLNEAMAKGKGGLDATKQLQKQVAEAESAALMDALNKTNKALTEAGVNSITELNADAKRNLQERIKEELGADRAQKFLEDAGQSIKDLTSSMTKRATENGLDLQKLAKDKGYANVQALEAALQSNVKDERETALQALGEIDQLVSRKERTSQDPITNIRDTLLDINNWLRSVVESQLFKLSNGVASFIYWAGQAVALLGSIAAAIFMIRNGWGMLTSAISMMRGGGSMAASAAASALGGGGPAAVRATPPPLPPGYSPPAAASLPAAAATTAATGAAAAIPRATPPPLPAAAATTAAAGAAPAAATAARSRFPRVSGRGALIAAGLAAAGGYLYYKMSGKKDQASAAGVAGGAEGAMPDNDTVIGLLKQIEINTRGGGVGDGGGGIPVGHYEEGPEGQIRRPRFGQRPPVPLGPAKTPEDGGGMGSTLATAAALAAPAAAATLLPRINAYSGITAPPVVDALNMLPQSAASTTGAAAGAAPAAASGGGFFSRLAGKAGNAWSSVKGAANSAWQGTKSAASTAWEGTKSAAGAAGKFVLDKTGLSKVTEWLGQNVKSLVPNFLKTSGGAISGGLKKVLGKIPVVGTIIESIFTGMRIDEIAKSQNMTKEDMYKEMGASVISSGLGLLGGSLAAAMISAPQALGIPSWLLAPLAYMGGDWLGRLVGNAISDYIGGPTLGKAIFDLFYSQAPGGKETPKAEEGSEIEMPPVNDRGLVEFAEGGIVSRPTRALIGEAGPEAVIPLSKKVINFQNEVLESKFDMLLENFKAVSKFLSMGGVFGSAISGLGKWINRDDKEDDKSEGFGSRLIKAIDDTAKATGSISFSDMGAFAKGEITEAMMQGVQSILKTIGIKEDKEEKKKEQIATGKDSSKESSEISDQFRFISKSNTKLIDRQSKEFDASEISNKIMNNVTTMRDDTFGNATNNRSILSVMTKIMPDKITEPESMPFAYAPKIKGKGKDIFGAIDYQEFILPNITSGAAQSNEVKAWMAYQTGKDGKKASANYSEIGAFKPGEISDAMSEASRKEMNEMYFAKEIMSNAVFESLKDKSVSKSDGRDVIGSSVTKNADNSLSFATDKANNSIDMRYLNFLSESMNDKVVNNANRSNITGFISTMDRSLNGAVENMQQIRNVKAVAANAGLFASDHIDGAVDEVANQYLRQQMQSHLIAEKKSGVSESILNAINTRNSTIEKGEATQLSSGLFSRDDNISQATDESVNSVVSKVLNTSDMSSFLARSVQEKQELQKKQSIFADLSRALSYDTAASDADVSVTGNQTEAMLERGEVATNALDYSDDLQGTVSTLLTNRDSVESYLEREKMGSASSNASLLPNMDEIASYLISTQAEKLDQMISLLGDIKNNTAATGGYISDIIGPVADGLPPMTRPGVKSIAQDHTRGKWDLTFTDSSPSTVTTEGRGGSA